MFSRDEPLLTENDLESGLYDEYVEGGYSPRLLRPSELEPDQLVYDPEDDIKRLEYARRHVMKTGKTVSATEATSIVWLSYLKYGRGTENPYFTNYATIYQLYALRFFLYF